MCYTCCRYYWLFLLERGSKFVLARTYVLVLRPRSFNSRYSVISSASSRTRASWYKAKPHGESLYFQIRCLSLPTSHAHTGTPFQRRGFGFVVEPARSDRCLDPSVENGIHVAVSNHVHGVLSTFLSHRADVIYMHAIDQEGWVGKCFKCKPIPSMRWFYLC